MGEYCQGRRISLHHFYHCPVRGEASHYLFVGFLYREAWIVVRSPIIPLSQYILISRGACSGQLNPATNHDSAQATAALSCIQQAPERKRGTTETAKEHRHHRSLLDYESNGHERRGPHQISASVSVESSIFRRSFMSGRHGLPLPVPSERNSIRLQIAFHVASQASVFRRHAALHSRGHLLTFATEMQGCFP